MKEHDFTDWLTEHEARSILLQLVKHLGLKIIREYEEDGYGRYTSGVKLWGPADD